MTDSATMECVTFSFFDSSVVRNAICCWKPGFQQHLLLATKCCWKSTSSNIFEEEPIFWKMLLATKCCWKPTSSNIFEEEPRFLKMLLATKCCWKQFPATNRSSPRNVAGKIKLPATLLWYWSRKTHRRPKCCWKLQQREGCNPP